MRILHVFDQAGVAPILAKYQNRLGHYAEVIMRDGYDGVDIHKFYGSKIVTPKIPRINIPVVGNVIRYSLRTVMVLMFYLYVLVYSRKFDIVHIHSCWLASFFTFKPKVIEFHGDEIRSHPSKRWWVDTLFTRMFLDLYKNKLKFLVSTPDLLCELPEAEWLENPVDTELFSYTPLFITNQRAIYFHNWHEPNVERAQKISESLGCELTVINRKEKQSLSYPEMPKFLIPYRWFIDRTGIKSLSKTALEALSVGKFVIDYKGEMVLSLPLEHTPFKVAEKSIKIYEGEIRKFMVYGGN